MRILAEFPRWLFLATLVYAPWAYGCTRRWTIEVFNALALTVVGFWIVGCIARRRRPQIPTVPVAAVSFLLFQGWWMILNAHYFYDRADFRYQFVPVSCLLSFAPGVVDRVDAIPAMVRITGLLGIVCFVSDLIQRPQWRTRIWWTIGLTGVSLTAYGLALRVAGVVMVNPYGEVVHQFFAGYRYHANAGAFINLVFPPIAGLAVMAFEGSESNLQRSFWGPGLLVCLAGAVAAASKAAMVVTALLVLVFALRQTLIFFQQRESLSSVKALVLGLGGIVAVGLAIVGIGSGAAMEKWQDSEQIGESWGMRKLCYEACTHMLKDSGAWGFGPGNFKITFPHYTGYLGDRIRGIWSFAHEDYLQTLIEWGWVGASVWAILFFGGIVQLWRKCLKERSSPPSAERLWLFASLLALLGVALHALVDFPLQIASLQLYVATYLGIAWGSSQMTKRVDDGRNTRRDSI